MSAGRTGGAISTTCRDDPAEFRQPWRRAGMLPGKSELVDSGGLNPDMANATSEGGERNGVMTAVDDFVAAHPKPIRVVVLPVYFGLAILVEEDVLAHSAKLRWHFDRLESENGKDQLMKLAERAHLKAMIYQHAASQRADDRHARLATRFLHAVAGSIGADDAGDWCRALVDAGAGDVVLADVDDAAYITIAAGPRRGHRPGRGGPARGRLRRRRRCGNRDVHGARARRRTAGPRCR